MDPLLAVLVRLLGLVGVAKGFIESPRLRVRLGRDERPSNPPDLQWLHLSVRNVGMPAARHTKAARNLRVQVRIEGRAYDMMFGGTSGPVLSIDLAGGFEASIPLAVRSRDAGVWVKGSAVGPPALAVDLEQGVAYVTDVDFLTQKNPRARLPPGRHFIHATVASDEGGATAQFWLTVPGELTVRMALDVHRT